MLDYWWMGKADEVPYTIDEIASKLKCARGWIQLSIDAGCPQSEEGKIRIRDFMLFQLTNIHKIRELAGLEPIMADASKGDLRPNVKAILTTQLEWLQLRSSKDSVKKAAKLVFDRLQTMSEI